MIETDYFVRTIIPVPNLDWSSVWGNTEPRGQTTHRWRPVLELDNIWSNDISEKLTSVGLKPLMARIFKWHSKSYFPWHIDGNEKGATKCALNWVVSGNGVIQWNEHLVLDGETNGLATAAQEGNYNDSYSCSTQVEDVSYLVRTDIPHRVFGVDPTIPRVTISILFQHNWMWPYNRVRDCLCDLGFAKIHQS